MRSPNAMSASLSSSPIEPAPRFALNCARVLSHLHAHHRPAASEIGLFLGLASGVAVDRAHRRLVRAIGKRGVERCPQNEPTAWTRIFIPGPLLSRAPFSSGRTTHASPLP